MLFTNKVQALDGYGVHLLHPEEIITITPEFTNDQTFFITIPFSLFDRNHQQWTNFFEYCQKHRLTPIIRLTSRFENNHWTIPNKKEFIDGIDFINTLPWPEPRHVILFNEPNHAAEWAGSVDPVSFATVSLFAANWLNTEEKDYFVLLAGLDAAAPNSAVAMDNLTFMRHMFEAEPTLLNAIDGWVSHSYPNPDFTSSVYSTTKQGIRGFVYELDLLSQLGRPDLPVFITETGWRQTPLTIRSLLRYFQYAHENVWSHPQIKAVTFFLLQGNPGPFAEFSLLDPEGLPTAQLDALDHILGIKD